MALTTNLTIPQYEIKPFPIQDNSAMTYPSVQWFQEIKDAVNTIQIGTVIPKVRYIYRHQGSTSMPTPSAWSSPTPASAGQATDEGMWYYQYYLGSDGTGTGTVTLTFTFNTGNGGNKTHTASVSLINDTTFTSGVVPFYYTPSGNNIAFTLIDSGTSSGNERVRVMFMLVQAMPYTTA